MNKLIDNDIVINAIEEQMRKLVVFSNTQGSLYSQIEIKRKSVTAICIAFLENIRNSSYRAG
jgi:hypothetical protein